MSDPNDTSHRPPRSSSSTTAAGTHALSITVEDDKKPASAEAEAKTKEPATAAAASEDAPSEDADSNLTDSGADPTGSEPTLSSGVAEMPALEIVALNPVAAEQTAPKRSEVEELRAEVRERLVRNEAEPARLVAILQGVSIDFGSVIKDARDDAARLTFKLVEFAEANLCSNIELARDCANVRSIPEMVGVQAAYFQRQMELINRQADELRKLTAEITSRKAAQFHLSITRQ